MDDYTNKYALAALKDAKTIRPKQIKRVKLFDQGELSRMVLDVLRNAGKPVTTPEAFTAVLAASGNDESAKPALGGRVGPACSISIRSGGR